MVVAGILVAAGFLLMVTGAVVMSAWLSGKSRLFDASVLSRRGDTVDDRRYMNFYFFALVLTPLLGGGIMIVFGLRLMF